MRSEKQNVTALLTEQFDGRPDANWTEKLKLKMTYAPAYLSLRVCYPGLFITGPIPVAV